LSRFSSLPTLQIPQVRYKCQPIQVIESLRKVPVLESRIARFKGHLLATGSRSKVRGRDVRNGERAPRASRHGIREAIALGGAAGAAVWGFLSSRRWLVIALLATCGLLAVLTMGRPKHLLVLEEPELPETKFDDVTNLGMAPGSWFHRWTADAANSAEKAQVAGLTLGAPPADDSEPPDAMSLTRRLDAVRSRQSKGAILTGKIDAVNATARQSSNAPLRMRARLLPPQTADSTSKSVHATPQTVFR
jgi:hypothetical protein